jgi:hypothetical protein
MRRSLAPLAFVAIACGSPPPATTPAPIEPLPAPPASASAQPAASADARQTPGSSAKTRSSACPDAEQNGAGKTPRETVDRARALLDRHCYRELIETLVDPDDVAKVTQDTPMDELVKKFVQQGKQKDLHKVLDDALDREPDVDSTTHVADYGGIPHGALRMREINGRWYIKN